MNYIKKLIKAVKKEDINKIEKVFKKLEKEPVVVQYFVIKDFKSKKHFNKVFELIREQVSKQVGDSYSDKYRKVLGNYSTFKVTKNILDNVYGYSK